MLHPCLFKLSSDSVPPEHSTWGTNCSEGRCAGWNNCLILWWTLYCFLSGGKRETFIFPSWGLEGRLSPGCCDGMCRGACHVDPATSQTRNPLERRIPSDPVSSGRSAFNLTQTHESLAALLQRRGATRRVHNARWCTCSALNNRQGFYQSHPV